MHGGKGCRSSKGLDPLPSIGMVFDLYMSKGTSYIAERVGQNKHKRSLQGSRRRKAKHVSSLEKERNVGFEETVSLL